MTADPQWYTASARIPRRGRPIRRTWDRPWRLADPAAGEPDGSYIMQAAMAAFALRLHRTGGTGVLTCRYDLLDGAVVIIVGRPGAEAPATMEEARARIVVQAQEIERLRAEAAGGGSTARVLIRPDMMRRIQALGFEPGSGDIVGWLVGEVERGRVGAETLGSVVEAALRKGAADHFGADMPPPDWMTQAVVDAVVAHLSAPEMTRG